MERAVNMGDWRTTWPFPDYSTYLTGLEFARSQRKQTSRQHKPRTNEAATVPTLLLRLVMTAILPLFGVFGI